jgi:protein-tyrosine phosphatase
MFRICEATGVSDVIVTPHGNYSSFSGFDYKEKIQNTFKELKKQLLKNNINVNLHQGMEVMADYGLEYAIENKDLFLLADTNNMLIEFPFNADWDHMCSYIDMITSLNIQPIIAHPERYYLIIDNPAYAFELVKNGFILQLDSASVLGDFGRRVQETADILLRYNLVQLVGSDTHDLVSRKPNLLEAYHVIANHFSEGYADLLFTVNPQFLLDKKKVLIVNPINPLM